MNMVRVHKQQFENAGIEYAKNLSLTAETIKTLQSLMIPPKRIRDETKN